MKIKQAVACPSGGGINCKFCDLNIYSTKNLMERRMSNQNVKSASSIVKFVSIVFIFTSLIFVFGLVGASRHVEGSFESWISLKSLPEKVVHLLNTDGEKVWVGTENSNVYYTNYDCHKPECWVKTDSLPNEDEMAYYSKEKGKECNNFGFYPVSQPKNSIECMSINYDAADSVAHYALINDGTVWVWSHSFGGITDIEPEKFLISICSVPIGLIFGLLVAMLLYRKRNV
jgi:hypothetical protein